MTFKDEFEFEASDGQTYIVEVEGKLINDENQSYVELTELNIYDELGVYMEENDITVMDEIREEARFRDYKYEEAANFDFYDHNMPEGLYE